MCDILSETANDCRDCLSSAEQINSHINIIIYLLFFLNYYRYEVIGSAVDSPGLELTRSDAYALFPPKYLIELFEKLFCDWPSATERIFGGFALKFEMFECRSSFSPKRKVNTLVRYYYKICT